MMNNNNYDDDEMMIKREVQINPSKSNYTNTTHDKQQSQSESGAYKKIKNNSPKKSV